MQGSRPQTGPSEPPDRFPAHAGPPPGHRQAHHTPQRPPPAACRVSSSGCEIPSPFKRWRTPARDNAGAHEQLPAGGTPLGMGLPTPGHTPSPTGQRHGRLHRAVAQVRYGRPRGPSPASGDTAHTTAPRASAARGHGGATAAESPPRTMSSVEGRAGPASAPPAACESEGDAVVVRHHGRSPIGPPRRYRARYVTTPAP